MKTIYLDCGMGAAGDMLTGALLELLPDGEEFLRQFHLLGIPGVEITAEKSVKCGITGTHMLVKINGTEEHEDLCYTHHHGMADVEQIISLTSLPECVKSDVLAVYRLIAEGESLVHGVPVNQVHFHEVGALDAIADVTAVCMLMRRLNPQEVVASPVHVGSGTVRCAHGILPVPAPATACILKDIPIYGGSVMGELCTPTGAALLRHFVTRFGDMPVMRVQKIGYGMGSKDFERPNCVRAMLGQTESQAEPIVELNCNVDDMTGEAVGFALEQFLSHGALEAYTVAVGMKKSRPGIKICVLCRESDQMDMVSLIFKHTSTLGIRQGVCNRYTLNREIRRISTPLGTVRKKVSSGYGVERSKFEYEDLAAIAREHSMSIADVLKAIEDTVGI